MRMALALVAISVICTANAFADQLPIPTSLHPPQGSPWRVMHEDSFERTPEAAEAACLLAAAVDSEDALTPQKCTLFARHLRFGACSVVMVPNGIVFDYMLYRRGETTVQAAVLKDLQDAEKHEAKLCDLGDGVWGFLFDGDRGCNNPAFVFEEPLAPSGQWVCPVTARDNSPAPTQGLYLSGILLQRPCGCDTYIPGLVVGPRQAITSTQFSGGCRWISNQ